jgi:hypothetical protein
MRRVVSVLSHPQHAGMVRALRILDEAAPAAGWTMTHVVPEANGLVATMLPPDRTIVIPGVAGWRRWTSRLGLPTTIARLARAARGADVLYAVTLSTLPHCLLAGGVTGVPAVVHVYSSYGDPRPYRKHWLGRARHVVAPSADSLRLAERAVGGFAPGTRARVAYNGMDVARIVRDATAPSPLPAMGAPTIGMVGNQDARKNPALVVEAAGILRRTVPDLRVVLVGAFPDPAYETAVRARAAALGLGEVLVVTGFLANPFPVLRQLDVVVHPALRDPFPLALLEAMALARPIVAAAVGGIPEMLVDGESGVLVPADDAAALAAGIAPLLADRERRDRIGAAAHRRLTTVFTLERFTAEMFSAFADAAGEGA